ncbi:MAG: 4'-phosphopantetheinyl transferase superfamily protein [Saprospiraceae bacterium]
MPIIRHEQLPIAGELGVWQIQETEEWLLRQLVLYPQELRQLDAIKGRRRVEWLAVRQLVHVMSGREQRGAFVKDAFGKPHLEHTNWHISISHSHEWAAAIAAPVPCGIDIQFIVPKITRLAHRFLSKEELSCVCEPHALDMLHFFWGAKEAIYKAYGRKQLDFIQHIHITPFNWVSPKGQAKGKVIIAQEAPLWFDLYYERSPNGYMLVWALAQDNPLS